jgi:DNA-binding transcriptional regulator YdaS (Cro superfamily)
MSLLVNGKGRCSAELANVLHSLTNGEVPREELRPDIFKVPT